jgi:hypothetical protein
VQLQQLPSLHKAWIVVFNLLFGILHPSSVVRVLWDMGMLLALLYIAVMVPIFLCFSITAAEVSPAMFTVDKVVDVLFIIDVYMNLRSAYFNPINNQVRSLLNTPPSNLFYPRWLEHVYRAVCGVPADGMPLSVRAGGEQAWEDHTSLRLDLASAGCGELHPV